MVRDNEAYYLPVFHPSPDSSNMLMDFWILSIFYTSFLVLVDMRYTGFQQQTLNWYFKASTSKNFLRIRYFWFTRKYEIKSEVHLRVDILSLCEWIFPLGEELKNSPSVFISEVMGFNKGLLYYETYLASRQWHVWETKT